MLGLCYGQGIFFTLICDLVLGLFSLSRFGVEAGRLCGITQVLYDRIPKKNKRLF